MPAGRGLRKAALAPGRDETWAVNPLVCKWVDLNLTTEGVQLNACDLHKTYVKS